MYLNEIYETKRKKVEIKEHCVWILPYQSVLDRHIGGNSNSNAPCQRRPRRRRWGRGQTNTEATSALPSGIDCFSFQAALHTFLGAEFEWWKFKGRNFVLKTPELGGTSSKSSGIPPVPRTGWFTGTTWTQNLMENKLLSFYRSNSNMHMTNSITEPTGSNVIGSPWSLRLKKFHTIPQNLSRQINCYRSYAGLH